MPLRRRLSRNNGKDVSFSKLHSTIISPVETKQEDWRRNAYLAASAYTDKWACIDGRMPAEIVVLECCSIDYWIAYKVSVPSMSFYSGLSKLQ